MSYWGYNSVDTVLAGMLKKSSGLRWEEIDISETMSDLEGDSLPSGRYWSDPTAPVAAFLLSQHGRH